MTDIVVFLTARVDEDEQVARLGPRTPVTAAWSIEQFEPSEEGAVPAATWVIDDQQMGVGQVHGDFVAAHIARHDPARVLADVAAKRRILARHHAADTPHYHMGPDDPDVYDCVGCGYEGVLQSARTDNINDCPELCDLAAVYADHPDYDERWRLDT